MNCVSRSYQYELLVALLKVEVKGQPKEIRSSVVSTTKFQVEIGTHIRLILLNSLRSVVHNGDALFELSEMIKGKLLLEHPFPPGYKLPVGSCRLRVSSQHGTQLPRLPARRKCMRHCKFVLELLKVNVFCQDSNSTKDSRGSDVFIVAALCAISRIGFRHKVLHSQHSSGDTVGLHPKPYLSITSNHSNLSKFRPHFI